MIKYEIELIGKEWKITCSNGLNYRIPNHRGMYYLTEIIKNPDCQIPFTLLVSEGSIPKQEIEFRGDCHRILEHYGMHEGNWHTGIPRSDMETICQVTLEMHRLQEKLRVLESYHDIAQMEIVQSELMKLNDYLTFTYSTRKIIKSFYSSEANLYFSVKKAIQRAYQRIGAQDHYLVLFLKSRIHMHLEYIQMHPYFAEGVRFQVIGNAEKRLEKQLRIKNEKLKIAELLRFSPTFVREGD